MKTSFLSVLFAVTISFGLVACGGSKSDTLKPISSESTAMTLEQAQEKLYGTWKTGCYQVDEGVYETSTVKFSKTKRFYSTQNMYGDAECTQLADQVKIDGKYVVTAMIKDNQFALDVTIQPATEVEPATVILTSFMFDGDFAYLAKEQDDLTTRAVTIEKSATYKYTKAE